MIDFGFSIQNDRQIDYDNNDRTLFYYIKRVEPSISICISCASCTATCTAATHSNLDFHKIMLFIRRGERVEIAREINKCQLCGKCSLVCPKGINTRQIVFLTRKFLQSNS
jgi:heterodisulfide reductase subunit C